MKDLKDYFNTSSTKSDNSKTPVESEDSVKNSTTDQCSKGKNGKTKKSKKINNETNISKVGKRKSDQKSLTQPPVENPAPTEPLKNIVNDEENTEVSDGNSELSSTPKTATVNAFQFLMNSRNKIIGTNSPGKEFTNEQCSSDIANKETLKVRKRLLQGWSDTKKSAKRKLEDEEIDKCIKVKLEVRKKRFKTLLNVESTENESSGDGSIKKFKDNLSSDDFECTTPKRSKKKKHKHKKKENVNLTPSKSWKMRIKLADEEDREVETVTVEEEEVIICPVRNSKQSVDVIVLDQSPIPKHSEENKRVLRNRTSLQKPKQYADYSDEDSDDQKRKKNLKVAPVFMKSVPRPKEDPQVVEARRKFLLSEMPEVLKRKIEKQESVTVPEFDVFPKIAHVRQENSDEFWRLPEINLKRARILDYKYDPGICTNMIDRCENISSQYDVSKPLKNIKIIIKNLKLENPAYPVYRTYRILKEKHGKSEENSAWTDKYKPTSSEDLMGNAQAISTLKTWLETWNEMFVSRSRKKSKVSSDSESDFQSSSDAESNCSIRTGVILIGPCGSGKSSTVYALCNELGFEVIELNASSRRTGKQVLQELQEATQSHQVRKNKNIFQGKTSKKPRKMCVLLIEDIDIVFEQDEGFIFAISQISSSTKRPIILTTTDKNSPNTQKFINDFKIVKFRRISIVNLGIWAQIICLLEGTFVDNRAIMEFFERNNGDVRKTLLELQLWVESGGQINKNNSLTPILAEETGNDAIEVEDDEVSLKEFAGKLENYRIHQNVVLDFEIFRNNLPVQTDLRKIWWNFPQFMNVTCSKKSGRNREKLKIISSAYDSIAICDMSYRKMGYKCDVQICGKRWDFVLGDSLRTDEIHGEFSSNHEFSFEWSHFLLDKSVENCRKRFVIPQNQRLDMGIPNFVQQSESMKNHRYEEELMTAVPLSSHLDRKSVSLDYLATLRNFVRLEKKREGNNCKRNNRFYNYLQNFNVDCSNKSMLDFASNTFRCS